MMATKILIDIATSTNHDAYQTTVKGISRSKVLDQNDITCQIISVAGTHGINQ